MSVIFTPTLVTTILANQPARKIQVSESKGSKPDYDDDDEDENNPLPVWAWVALVIGFLGLVIGVCLVGR